MSTISRRILNNLPLKIGAVFFAALLWFHTTTEKNYEYTFEVTHSEVKLPKGLKLTKKEIPPVEVRLGGKGKSLLQCFDKKALTLNIDLTNYKAGTFEYPIDPSDIVLPKTESLSVIDVIFPKFIRLQLIKKT